MNYSTGKRNPPLGQSASLFEQVFLQRRAEVAGIRRLKRYNCQEKVLETYPGLAHTSVAVPSIEARTVRTQPSKPPNQEVARRGLRIRRPPKLERAASPQPHQASKSQDPIQQDVPKQPNYAP